MSGPGRRFLAFSLGAAALALATQAQAATYHVRPDGHDTNCNGLTNASDASTTTQNCAFLTIQKAVSTWTGSGNTVLLHAGTINGGATCTNAEANTGSAGPSAVSIYSTKSGAAGAYNVIKAAGDGAVSVSANGCEHQFHVTGSYIQIGGLAAGEGFTVLGNATMAGSISGFPADGVITFRGSATNDRVYGLNFLANNAAFIDGDTGHSQIVVLQSGNLNHHIAGNTFRIGNIGGAVRVQNPGAVQNWDCDTSSLSSFAGGVIVENNVVNHDKSDETTNHRVQAFGGEYARDTIYRNNTMRLGTAAAPGGTNGQSYYGISLRQNCRATVENNYIEAYNGSGGSWLIYMFNAGSTFNNQRHHVYNNTVYGKGDIGIYSAAQCQNCEWFNNLVRGVSANSFSEGIRTSESCSGPFPLINGYNAASNAVTNFSTCAGDSNLGNNITADPLLTLSGNHPTPFLQLQSTSPLKDVGCNRTTTCPNAPSTDYEIGARTSPRGDIGADEFGSGGTCNNNGVRDAGEACDGTSLGGATCVTLGFTGGTLSCTASCAFNTTNCTSSTNTPPPGVQNLTRTDKK